MRYTLLIGALLLCGYTWSQPVRGQAPEGKGVSIHNPATKSEQENEPEKEQQATRPQSPLLVPRYGEVKPSLEEPKSPKEREEETRRQKDDLKAQQEQASYAYALIWVSGITGFLIFIQLVFFGFQVLGARKEFISTHRPRIIVRRVSLNNAQGATVRDILGAEYVVANIGNTPAKIIEINARLWLTEPNENLPAIPPYGQSTFPNLRIAAGESAPLTHLESSESSNEFHFRDGFMEIAMDRHQGSMKSGMFFLGYVVYEDGNRVKRRTAFLREYHHGVRRFEPIPHPDYEYQD